MLQKYGRSDRQAIKKLSPSAQALFKIVEAEEKGVIVDVPGLCLALENPSFVIFSCLSGNGEREELGTNLGVLFTTRLNEKAQNFMALLRGAGFQGRLQVIVDDTEPVRFWNWHKKQSEITTWCRMVVEDAEVPEGWEIRLWSDIEAEIAQGDTTLPTYSDFYTSASSEVARSAVFHQLSQHIKQFPNQGLSSKNVPLVKAVTDKLVQYKFQGMVLEKVLANRVLLQTETPWEVKDLLFHGPLGNSFASIIHPFERRR